MTAGRLAAMVLALAPSASLTAAGVATWNLEYRRVDDPGGGWPATFLDVGAGIDHLRALAPAKRLDLGRVVGADPLPMRGVVALAGVRRTVLDLLEPRAGGDAP